MISKRGFTAHILIIVVAIIAIWGLVIWLLIAKGIIKKPSIPGFKKEPKVELKTEYKNPFDKKTQYVNPFDKFKNPLANLK